MTHGSCMESLSGSGRAGFWTRDCFLPCPVSRLAPALELAILAGLVGDGTTGDLTGITTMSFITTTLTYPTAESSPITTLSIAGVRTPIMVADFRVDTDFKAEALAEIRGSTVQPRNTDLQLRNTDLRRRMFSPVIPARSAALIMEEFPEDSPLAGSRVSAAAFMAVAVSTAVAAEGFTGGGGGRAGGGRGEPGQ